MVGSFNNNTSNVRDIPSGPALNYYRLARLTIEAGTEQVRRSVLENLPNGQSLHSALDRNRAKLTGLYSRRIISDKQWRALFPEHNNADPSTFDLTLWIILLRNIAHVRVKGLNWNDSPGPDQQEW